MSKANNKEPSCYTETREYREAFFDHMAKEHGLNLLESERVDIEQLVINGPDFKYRMNRQNMMAQQSVRLSNGQAKTLYYLRKLQN